MIGRSALPLILSLLGLVMLLPAPADACAVCLGDPDSPMSAGVNNAILFLLVCVGVVQVGFVALFWSFRTRSRRLAHRREQFSRKRIALLTPALIGEFGSTGV